VAQIISQGIKRHQDDISIRQYLRMNKMNRRDSRAGTSQSISIGFIARVANFFYSWIDQDFQALSSGDGLDGRSL
jgi:hypothetical protein